jgi:hypothetical protein
LDIERGPERGRNQAANTRFEAATNEATAALANDPQAGTEAAAEGFQAATTAVTITMAPSTSIPPLGPLDQLDASLDEFVRSIGSPNNRPTFGYPSAHSGFRSDDMESEADDSDSEASAGGYSPPVWRRLGNGDHSSGFWRKGDRMMYGDDDEAGHSRESSPEYESADEILAQAIRTRLPTGSLSPEKERSPEPEYHLAQQHLIDDVVNVKQEDKGDMALSELKHGLLRSKEVADNCMS